MQHDFPHSPAHTTFSVFLPRGGGAGEQAKCAERFDIPAAVQNARLFSLSWAEVAPLLSFFLPWG